LVIALIFAFYPESVLPVWISMPLAIGIGFWVYRRGGGLLVPSVLALLTIYAAIYIGAYYLPIDVGSILNRAFGVTLELQGPFPNVVILWTFVLLVYCFCASVLPVWVLLQPRDYINSHQLVVALVLLAAGLFMAGFSGSAELTDIPAIANAADIPKDAPPIFPFLFITIACGACSGFHCLVSSGTSSKQVASEMDAQYVGYGAMLLEGGLAVMVILACCAGVGMGLYEQQGSGPDSEWHAVVDADGQHVTGLDAWKTRYDVKRGWENFTLANKVKAFIEGGANFLSAVGIPLKLGIGIVAVLVACFAATTLDTATRLQRYVIQELAGTLRIKPLTNKYLATGLAAGLGCLVALIPASPEKGPGSGGLILWPLFGAINQLLAGLAFMVTFFYLWRRNKPVLFVLLPMLMMLFLPAWAMLWNMFNGETGWLWDEKYLLFAFGVAVMILQIWMVVEALVMFPRTRGLLEEELPPLTSAGAVKPAMLPAGGRSC
jgi:carbon starvation protein